MLDDGILRRHHRAGGAVHMDMDMDMAVKVDQPYTPTAADAIRRATVRMVADAVEQRAAELKGCRGPVAFHLIKLAAEIRQMGPLAP